MNAYPNLNMNSYPSGFRAPIPLKPSRFPDIPSQPYMSNQPSGETFITTANKKMEANKRNEEKKRNKKRERQSDGPTVEVNFDFKMKTNLKVKNYLELQTLKTKLDAARENLKRAQKFVEVIEGEFDSFVKIISDTNRMKFRCNEESVNGGKGKLDSHTLLNPFDIVIPCRNMDK